MRERFLPSGATLPSSPPQADDSEGTPASLPPAGRPVFALRTTLVVLAECLTIVALFLVVIFFAWGMEKGAGW